MKNQLSSELQTSATSTPTADESAHAAGVGGSYSLDPVTRKPTLVHRTEGVAVSRKAPLTDADGKPVPPDQA